MINVAIKIAVFKSYVVLLFVATDYESFVWTVTLPEWYCGMNCLDVIVKESHIGTEIGIPEYR